MAVSRLILLEGMIGSGKTTTAANIGKWLADQGDAAHVYHEFADDHPIRTKAVTSSGQPFPKALFPRR